MKLEFEWCGLKCLAIGELEDGLFVPDTIDVMGTLNSPQLSGDELDNLISIMDEKCEEVKGGDIT